MNLINKNFVVVDDKKVFLKDVVAIIKWSKGFKLIQMNSDILDITDERMAKRFGEKLEEKINFVFFENRYLNLEAVKSVKVKILAANKEYSVVADFGERVETFNFESEPAAEEFKKQITRAINNYQYNRKHAGLTR